MTMDQVGHYSGNATTELWSVNTTDYINITMTVDPTNPGISVSEFAQTADFVCNDILLPLIVILGIVGNALNLVVLTRKSMYSSTTIFLTGLAISDMLLMIMQVIECFNHIPDLKTDTNFMLVYRYFCVARYMFSNMFITCTSWITIGVAIERFIAIRYTLKVKIICTTKRAKISIILIFLVSFIFHFSKFFEYEPNLDLSSPQPILFTVLSNSALYNSILHYTNISVAVWIPSLLLLIFNTLLIFFLIQHKRGSKLRKESGAHEGDTVKITIVVVAMVCVFLICHANGVLLAMLIIAHGREYIIFKHPIYSGLRHVSNLMVITNSGVNFILYCSISRKFRKVFCEVFNCNKKHTGSGSKKSVSSTSSRSTSLTNVSHFSSRSHIPIYANIPTGSPKRCTPKTGQTTL